MRTLVSLLVLYLVGSSDGFDCRPRQQRNGFISRHYGACNCNPINFDEIYCPEFDFITVKAKQRFKTIDIVCGAKVEANNLTQYLASLDIPASYPTIRFIKVNFKKCPLTEDPPVAHLKDHFQYLPEVRQIHLSSFVSDDLVKLDKGIFEGLPNLAVLEISDNTVNEVFELDPKIFQPVPNLVKLVLRNCDIKSLNEDTFQNLVRLKVLNLYNNKLTNLPQGVFRDLRKLEVLNLHDNNISHLPPGIFDGLQNLQNLSLYKNSLTSLPKGIFDQMLNLTKLKLSENQFNTLPGKLFTNNEKLQKLLWHNTNESPVEKLQLPSDLFHESNLMLIHMLFIRVEKIPEELLAGKEDIIELQIQLATIESLPEKLFRDTKNIGTIDFANNLIKKLPNGLFRNLRQLTKLRFNKNKLTEVSDKVFAGLENLKEVDLSENLIHRIDPNAFVSQRTSLQKIELGHNKISLSSEQSFTRMSNNLLSINLEYNEIDAIQEDWKTGKNHLKNLNLQGNRIGPFLHFSDIKFSSNKLDLDLSLNAIEKILVFEDLPNEEFNKEIKIKIGINPIICDCILTKIKEKQKFNNLQLKWKPGFLRCGEHSLPHLINQTIENVDYNDLNCEFPSNKFDVNCPPMCQCNLNRYNRQVTVNCSNQKMQQIPENLHLIPEESDSINLIMNNNLLKNIHDLEYVTNFAKIHQLFLSHNNLDQINSRSLPPHLTNLSIDHNNIQMINNPTILYLSNTIKNKGLKMGHNPYECSCSIVDLFNFIKSNQSLITDLGYISTSCSTNLSLIKFSEMHYDNCIWPSHMSIASAGASAVIIIILLTIIIITSVWYKEPIFIWLYSQPCSNHLFREDPAEREKPFDAFLSYSHLDAAFVEGTLLSGLEQPQKGENKFKCCIHTR